MFVRIDRRDLRASAIAIAIIAPATLEAQTPAATDQQLIRVDSVFARWRSTVGPGCAVGASKNGSEIVRRAYGMADLEHRVANTPETVFEAGSVSKQFTATAILLLAQDGKLATSDDVRKYVPELPDYGTPITIDHLLHHTSGLRDWGVVASAAGWPRGARVHSHAHVLDIVSRQKALNYPPGAEYSYTNTGYNLMAIIVERVSGESFASFTRRRIFEPLGMSRTQWRDDYTRIVPDRAIAYSPAGATYRLNMPFEQVHGNGGLLTTVGDLLRWNENFTHRKVGGAALVTELERRGVLTNGRTISYARGLVVAPYDGVLEVSHSGSTAGYVAYLLRFPEQRLSVAVLCNVSAANPTALARATANVFREGGRVAASNGSTENASTISVPTQELQRRVGVYRSRRSGEAVRFELTDGVLRAVGAPPLRPGSANSYQIGTTGDVITFDSLSTSGRPIVRLVSSEADTVFYEPAEPALTAPNDMAAYAGRYHSDEAEVTYVVEVKDGAAVLTRRPDVRIPMAPVYRDAFTAQGMLVRFIRDRSGKVTEMSFGMGRVRELKLARVK